MVFQIAYLFSLVVANFVGLRILICCRSQLVCSIEEGFLSSLCWITDGQITHLVVEGLLPPTGIDPTQFQNFCVSEVHATISDFRISFQCHVTGYTAQKMKFSIADFFSKWKKSVIENFIFCAGLRVFHLAKNKQTKKHCKNYRKFYENVCSVRVHENTLMESFLVKI